MRKISLIVLAAAGVSLAGAAQAADIAARPVYTKAPAPAMSYMWQGAYIGLYAGGTFGANDATTTVPATAAGAPNFAGASASYKYGTSFLGGFTSGYNWQLSPNWVIGYESEKGYISLKGSSTYPGSAATTAVTRGEGLYSLWAARFGYAFDRSLIYVKGGATLMNFQVGASNPTAGNHIDTLQGKSALGYAIGGGWEYALDPKWSLKAEYMYLGFDKNITTTGNLNGNAAQLFTTTSLAGAHTAKVGLNYKFDVLNYFLGVVR